MFHIKFSNDTPYFYKQTSKNVLFSSNDIKIQIMLNCALLSKGCRIVEQSASVDPSCSAQKILCECNSSWSSTIDSRPYCVIDFSQVEQRPENFDCIGFYSHTSQACTPFLIQVEYCTEKKWNLIGEFALQRVAGWQRFCFDPIPSDRVTLLRVRLTDNFDEKQVRLTQIAFGRKDEQTRVEKELQVILNENKCLKQQLAQQQQKMTRLIERVEILDQRVRFMMNHSLAHSSGQLMQVSAEKTLSEESVSMIAQQTREIIISDEEEPLEAFQLLS